MCLHVQRSVISFSVLHKFADQLPRFQQLEIDFPVLKEFSTCKIRELFRGENVLEKYQDYHVLY